MRLDPRHDPRLSPEVVRRRLGRLTDRPIIRLPAHQFFARGESYREAGVLMPLTERDERMHLVYTERAATLRAHAGEVSFPGGRHDPEDDTLERTALREAFEEIALHPADVSVFGAFVTVPTPSGFQITAYTGEFASPYALSASPDEVERLVVLPLDALTAPGVHRVEQRTYRGMSFPVHAYHYAEGHTPIWGATAFMTYSLLTFLGIDH